MTRELTLTAIHPGITVEHVKASTGWELRVAEKLQAIAAPTAAELGTLRDLHARTARAHGTVASE